MLQVIEFESLGYADLIVDALSYPAFFWDGKPGLPPGLPGPFENSSTLLRGEVRQGPVIGSTLRVLKISCIWCDRFPIRFANMSTRP
jgi:hypothetical protein